jgi:hypothetical protein
MSRQDENGLRRFFHEMYDVRPSEKATLAALGLLTTIRIPRELFDPEQAQSA